ncbi:hypothetical protein J1614_005155 [Plenodomus biglobosus]|nr:hypothetical protein J1614_005155 [Plenodomus biglobosus]
MGGTAVTDVPTRALIIALKSPPVGKSSARISELTGVDPRTIDRVYSRAIAAGFEPNVLPLKLLPKHVEDAPRSGRPVKEQTKDTKDQMMQQVRRHTHARDKTCADVAGGLSFGGIEILATTIWRVLREAGSKKTKPTRKTGLTREMKKQRLRWALDHQYWTLEDWKESPPHRV